MGGKHHRWRHWSNGGYGNFAVAKENVASKGTTPDLSMGAFSPAVPWKFDFCINTWVPRGRIRPTWAIGAITVLDDASSSIPFTSGTIRTRCSGRRSSRSSVSNKLFHQVFPPGFLGSREMEFLFRRGRCWELVSLFSKRFGIDIYFRYFHCDSLNENVI